MNFMVSVHDLLSYKRRGRKIIELTAYDYNLASILDATNCIDILLVGDSLGTTVQGHDTTLSVTLDEMVYHTKLVARATKNALIVADMPFMSYQISREEAIRNAGKLVQEGRANSIKLEGAGRNLKTIEALVEMGIPVQGHLGLTPQSVNSIGWKVQAKSKVEVDRLIENALALQDVGVFSLVLEAIPVEAAKQVSEKLTIPTIGIGAGKYCDGQVLVTYDLLNLTEFSPIFVKKYCKP